MSDSEDSTVTYTEVSSPFADLSDIGSPGVDGPPVMPEDPYAYVVAAFQAPPSPDYVPGPEEPEQAPPSPVYVPYVPELAYPEFMPPEDEVLPAKEQPMPATLSPTADSPGYVPEDPEEDDDEDPEEDPADYPADGGDDGDDEDELSNDDEDDDVDIEEDEEEEEHLAPADSTAVALPTVDHATSTEETEPFETDESAATPPPHPAYWVTARISIRDEPPTPFWSDTEVARLLAIHTLPLSPLSPWSSSLPHIPSPPLPLPSTDHEVDKPEVCLPPRKRLCFAFGPRYEVRESSSGAAARPTRGFRADYGFVATMDREIRRDLERDFSYGITDTWEEMLVDMSGAPATDDTEMGRRMIEFTTRVRQDTDEIYTRLDDEQSERQLMAGRLNMLYRDRRAHARTARLIEAKARISREAWG
ncbi:hypothetical protein Tco_0800432 [Tanacetum coccineum]|uniref:Uncharacterized protein n=1 Tax=Tanacetum coccineum TaxID=301880 RepID=A0ABQ4ZT32_9ASTR